MKPSAGAQYSKEETRLYLFLPDRAACTPCGENVGVCAALLAGQCPPSPTPRDFAHPEAPLAMLDTVDLSTVSLCAQVPPPCSALGS